MTIAPPTLGLDVVKPFNNGTGIVTDPLAVQPQVYPYPGGNEQPYRFFLSHVSNARNALTRSSELLHSVTTGQDPTPEAYGQATQGLKLIESALATEAPEKALEAVRFARGEVLDGLGTNADGATRAYLPPYAGAKFNSAVNWLNVAEGYAHYVHIM